MTSSTRLKLLTMAIFFKKFFIMLTPQLMNHRGDHYGDEQFWLNRLAQQTYFLDDDDDDDNDNLNIDVLKQ